MLSRLSANCIYKAAVKLNCTNLKIVANRSIHGVCVRNNENTAMRYMFDPNKRHNILRASFVRHASDGGGQYSPSILENIPDIPPFSVSTPAETFVYHANGEIAFSSIGLGGYSPVGILQYGLEWLHITCDMPWWAAIALGTVVVRLAVLPFLIDGLKTSAALNIHLPKIQEYQNKITQAKKIGDSYDVAAHMYELQDYMKKNDIKLLRSIVPLVVQMPIFISFFMALRQMANKPVESLKDGGLWWFNDLTLSDPYYILPVLTTTTFVLILYRSADGGMIYQDGIAKYFIYCMPVIIFPFTINFSTAIFCYWLSSNFISLTQNNVLKSSFMRKKLNLPKKEPVKSNTEGKNFIAEMKEAWSHAKMMKQLADRDRVNSDLFRNSASSAPLKTYKYDPIKQTPKTQILAKKQNL